jgi:hypothetical protein
LRGTGPPWRLCAYASRVDGRGWATLVNTPRARPWQMPLPFVGAVRVGGRRAALLRLWSLLFVAPSRWDGAVTSRYSRTNVINMFTW